MRFLSRSITLATTLALVFLSSSVAISGQTYNDTGFVSYGHPLTAPYGITDYHFYESGCKDNPYQGLDGYVFEIRKNVKRYSISATGEFYDRSMHLIFYEPTPTGCTYHSGHFYEGLQRLNQPIPVGPKWLLVSFSTARNIDVNFTTWWF